MKRPMVWVAVAFVAGMGAASAGAFPGWLPPLALLVAAVGVAWYFSARFASRSASVSMAAFAAGALLWNAQHTGEIGDALSRYAAENPQQDEWTIEGVVRLIDLEDSQPDRRQFAIDVDTVRVGGKTLALHGATMISQFRSAENILATQRLRVSGRLTLAIGRVNPNVSGYEDYLRSKGIHTALNVRAPDAVEILSHGRTWSAAYWASVFRRVQAGQMARVVPESALGFAHAIWLGYRGRIPQKEYQAFVESGTVHILSVSGIHMAMLFWMAWRLGGLATRSRRKLAVLVLTVIVLFTLMSGLRAATLRAAVMIAVYLMADLLDRERDARTALAVSAVVLLGWNPGLLHDTGFQLSFLSVASLLLFTEPLVAAIDHVIESMRGLRMPSGIDRGRVSGWRSLFARVRALPWPDSWHWNARRIWWTIREVLAASIAVQILAWPVVVHAFHVVPFGAPVANLAVIPLSTFALWLCLLTQTVGAFSESLAQVIGHALGPVVRCIQFVAEWVAKPSWAHPLLTSPTLLAMACYWGAALLWAAHRENPSRWKRLAPAIVLAIICVACWSPWRQEPMVAFLDVGHGDAIFIRSTDGRTMLMDGGDRRGEQDMGKNTIAPFLWCNHVGKLDCVVLSHPDRDHIGGLRYILERFKVGMVILGANATDHPLESELIEACDRRGVPVRRVHVGEKIFLGSMEAEVLHPPGNVSGADVNNRSLVLRVYWNGIRVLLSGDIESPAEARLARNDCAADVLKVPHHGSQTSSSNVLLRAVQPAMCVISTGGKHGREHVNTGVLERYRRENIPAWRTDWYGGIALYVRDGVVQVSGERILRGYPCPAPPVDNPVVRASR